MNRKSQSEPKPLHAISPSALREVVAANGSCINPWGQPQTDSGAGANPLGGG